MSVAKVWNRRLFLFDIIRERVLFCCTETVNTFFRLFPRAITLGEKVKIQRARSLRVEYPDAKIVIGDHSIIYENAKLEAYGSGQISIGSQCILGDIRITCRDSISFGDRVITSWNVFIQDFDPHPTDPFLRSLQVTQMTTGKKSGLLDEWSFPTKPVVIGNDVWIGANAIILQGAEIGDGCIVAAGAVVTAGMYPAGTVIGGTPARVLKELVS